MAYNQTYTAEDLSAITVDGIGKVGVGVIAFASIFGLILALYIGKKLMRK